MAPAASVDTGSQRPVHVFTLPLISSTVTWPQENSPFRWTFAISDRHVWTERTTSVAFLQGLNERRSITPRTFSSIVVDLIVATITITADTYSANYWSTWVGCSSLFACLFIRSITHKRMIPKCSRNNIVFGFQDHKLGLRQLQYGV